ncbi:hypothetical protein [Acinetobacter sp. WCHAc010052]|uniref:hypothetical protein n=1 Tax=Acinetobacter sp. WCHAc010052 TaxID=2004647 RepID=UPI000B3C4A1E|nr:hypothetical protein [Acinetobacter sp. WCHAc010052]AXY59481.1 hypothetical protein CDG61_05220 [Acinetobacter sp. WCHAc010052]
MKKDLWAVICGNIRDELDFKLTLSKLVQLRSEHKIHHILLSTWSGEIDKYEGLRAALKQLDVYVLESHPISDGLQATPTDAVNFWRQSRQLMGALDLIPKDSFILRVRTDRSLNYINQMEKMSVFDNYAVESISFGKFPRVFQYKVFVFSPKTVRLMHMIDFVFLGYHKDLYKLINFDVNELMFQKQVVANAQWFIKPFIEEFPVLRDYMRFTVFRSTIQLLKKYVDEKKEESVFPDIYYKVYAIFILIMHTHFKILYMGRVNDNTLSETGFHQFFSTSPGNNLYSTGLGTSIRNEKVLTYAVEGKLKPSESYSKFMDQIRSLAVHGNTVEMEYSYQDMKNLEDFVNSGVYDDKGVKWYKQLKTKPLLVNKKYKETYDVSALNCIKCESQLWHDLTETFSIEKELWSKWLEISSPKSISTERMLLPVAKTGIEYATYILLDMLHHNKISQVNISEVIRIVEFYLNISVTKKLNTTLTTRIAYKYLQLIKSGKILNPKINLNTLFSCVLLDYEKLYDNEESDYIKSVQEILTHHNLNDVEKKLLNSILIDMELESKLSRDEVLKFYQENNMKIDEKIVLKDYIREEEV